MRPYQPLSQPPINGTIDQKIDWLIQAVNRISDASQEDSGTYADPFTIVNPTPLRTLNASTATLGDVAQVLATFLQDSKRRGMNRASG